MHIHVYIVFVGDCWGTIAAVVVIVVVVAFVQRGYEGVEQFVFRNRGAHQGVGRDKGVVHVVAQGVYAVVARVLVTSGRGCDIH